MPRAMTPHRLTVAALVLLLVAVVVGNGLTATYTDIKPEVYAAPAAMVGHYLSSWTASPYLGSPNFNVGLTPVVLALAPLDLLGFSAKWIFLTSHVALWLIAATGAARLGRALSPSAGMSAGTSAFTAPVTSVGTSKGKAGGSAADSSGWIGLATAVCYVANPYAVVGGSTLAILLPMAFLPWMAYALVRALREPGSWRWPALVALAFVAQSGMNVAVIPIFQLLAVLPIAVVVGRAAGLAWPRIALVLSRCAVLAAAVSLYWLIPSLAAIGTGQQIVSESETVDGIAFVSTFVEVLRGMGIWTLYGRGPEGPWMPQFTAYESNPLVMAGSMLWPVLAVLSLAVAGPVLRRVASGLIALGAVVMAGLYAGAGTTPAAAVVTRLFDLIPPLLAFRTTNKAGAVLVLGYALALGHGIPLVVRRLRARRTAPTTARRLRLGLVAALVAAWVFPALAGHLYTSPADIPAYWRQAAAEVDARSHASRVLLLPGQTRPLYRWTDERPDDVPNSLLTREAVLPETTPNTSPPGANVLAALIDLVATGNAGSTTISTMARYLGTGDVLLRHDSKWEDVAGSRPAETRALLDADPGLTRPVDFGAPNENVAGKVPAVGQESTFTPLRLYAVDARQSTVTVRSTTGSILVAGDAWAFDPLARAGRLADFPVVTFAPLLSAGELASALPSAARLALTDTNRRQAAVPNRLSAGHGPLLAADSPAPAIARTLGDAADQTVLRQTGPTVVASQVGAAFFDIPYGQPENALDGNPQTAWFFGDFRRAPGVTLDIALPQPQVLHTVTVLPTAAGPVHIDQVTIEAGGERRSIRLPDTGAAEVDFGGVRADSVHLRIDSIRGEGYSLVGIAEIGLPGPAIVRIARLPDTLSRAYAALDPPGRAHVDRTPLDVHLTRVDDSVTLAEDDAETSLERDFTLPDPRTFIPAARIRVPEVTRAMVARLAGLPDGTTVTASTRLFDNPDLDALMAVDRDERTGWIPGGDAVAGNWWEETGPRRPIRAVDLVQRRIPSSTGAPGQYARRIAVLVDGHRVARVTTTAGPVHIRLPKGVRGRTVRIVLEAAGGSGMPPQIVRIDTGAGPLVPSTPPCVAVATVDGLPLRMRPANPAALAGPTQPGMPWRGCTPLTLAAGAHELRSVPDVTLDAVDLTDEQPATAAPGGDRAVLVSGSTTARTIHFDSGTDPVAVRIGEGYDSRWTATLDGRRLGPPVVLDGWSAGWIVDSPGAHTLEVRFGPQRAATIALVISGLTVLGCVGLALWPVLRRRPAAGTDLVPARPAFPTSPRLRALALAVTAGVAVGIPGVLAAATLLLARRRGVTATRIIVAGAAVLGLAMALQAVLAVPRWGEVAAMVTSHSNWPHVVAAYGLVLGLAAALLPNPDPPLLAKDAR